MYRYSMFMDKNNILKIYHFFLFIFSFRNSNKNLTGIFKAFNKTVLKCVWKNKGQELSVIIKGKKERLALSGIRTYYEAIVIKNLKYSHRGKNV